MSRKNYEEEQKRGGRKTGRRGGICGRKEMGVREETAAGVRCQEKEKGEAE